MSGCCEPKGYRQIFNSREAQRSVKRFEKHGLDSTAGPMVDALKQKGVAGLTLLEVGAGSGTAQVTLLEAGMESSVAYDISPAYETVAGHLLAARGLTEKVHWNTGDVTDDGDVAAADVVFLNRVICCYSEMERLVDFTASRANGMLALSYPRDRWFVRTGLRAINFFLRFRKVPFQVQVHPPSAIDGRVTGHGLVEIAAGSTTVWQWKVWQRPAA